MRRRFISIFVFQDLIHSIDRPSQMWNRDRTANYESNVEGIQKLGTRDANASTLFDVISNAIVTTQNGRSDKTEQFFRAFVERAGFVSLRIEREEAFDSQVIAAQQLFIHCGSITVEFVHCLLLSMFGLKHSNLKPGNPITTLRPVGRVLVWLFVAQTVSLRPPENATQSPQTNSLRYK